MTDLLFDLGNSRLKWANCRDGSLATQRARSWAELTGAAPTEVRLPRRVPARIWAVSVAGARREAWLTQHLQDRGFPAPRWLGSEPSAGGVRNGYREPARLGADRWMAILGAWHEADRRGPVAVIDAGTAITLDWVDAQGRHQGGLILPGPRLMVDSLLQGTAEIHRGADKRQRAGEPAQSAVWLARHTQGAVEAGAALAATAAIGQWLRTARRAGGRRTRVFVTGGAARTLLRSPGLSGALHVPDLVLRGVAFRAAC